MTGFIHDTIIGTEILQFETATYISVLPITADLDPFAVATCVTTANGSDVPLHNPATFPRLEACSESSTFIFVFLLFFLLPYENNNVSERQSRICNVFLSREIS